MRVRPPERMEFSKLRADANNTTCMSSCCGTIMCAIHPIYGGHTIAVNAGRTSEALCAAKNNTRIDNAFFEESRAGRPRFQIRDQVAPPGALRSAAATQAHW